MHILNYDEIRGPLFSKLIPFKLAEKWDILWRCGKTKGKWVRRGGGGGYKEKGCEEMFTCQNASPLSLVEIKTFYLEYFNKCIGKKSYLQGF